MKHFFNINVTFLVIIFIFSIFTSSSTSKNLFYFPTKFTYITSEFGYRDLYGVINFHDGIDFGAPINSDIYPFYNGTVIFVGFLNGYGNTVILSHENGYKSMYCHVSENFLISKGDFVTTNTVIAKVGPVYLSNGMKNGNTTGPHLHFSISKDNKFINPLNLNLNER